MKKLTLFLLLFLPLAAFAQSTKVVPDCVIPFNFTATGSTSNLTCGAPNGAPNTPGIASWIVVYESTGFSAVCLTVQSAPDSSGSPGTWVTFGGTVLSSSQYVGSSGINPNTATTSAFTGFAGYYPWMRVTLSSSGGCLTTGSGRVKGNLFGFLNSTLAKAGASGGANLTIAGTANEIAVTGAGCTPPNSGTCTISIPSNAIFPGSPSTPGTFTSGSKSGTTGLYGMIGKTSGNTSQITVDDNNTATQVKMPNDATGGLYAVTSPTASPAAGCAHFNGTATQATSTAGPCGAAGGSGGGLITYSGSVSLVAGGTFYVPLGGNTSGNVTEAGASMVLEASGPISNACVTLSAAPGLGNSVVVTLRDNGSNESVTMTISGAAATSACDSTDSFTNVAGDALDWSVLSNGVTNVQALRISAQYGAATAPLTMVITNASSTGTTTGTLTKLTGAPSTAVIAGNTDTSGIVGITISGAGTTGSATIQIAGLVNCVFSTATTAGHYVQSSSGCADTGSATYPTTGGQVIGRVMSTNGGAGTYQIDLFPAEIQPSSGGSSTSVHHQYYPSAAGTTSGSATMINGQPSTFLSAVPLGIMEIGAGGGAVNILVFLPSTWTGNIMASVDTSPSTNDTGNYALTPRFACVTAGFDMGAAPTYTAGSTVTQAAPGGSGTGFYRENMAITFAIGASCAAGNSVILNFVRASGDTYSHSIALYGIDVAITY